MYSDKKILEFTLENPANAYTNYSSMEIVLPIQFTKKTNKIAQIDKDTVTVNNFLSIGLHILILDVIQTT